MLETGGMTPSVETCLRIAGAANEHPSDVLRAAGHGATVAVLESAYRNATPTAPPLPSLKRSLFEVAERLTDLEVEEVRDYAAFLVSRRHLRLADATLEKGASVVAHTISRKRAK
jgi:hypothetical protein